MNEGDEKRHIICSRKTGRETRADRAGRRRMGRRLRKADTAIETQADNRHAERKNNDKEKQQQNPDMPNTESAEATTEGEAMGSKTEQSERQRAERTDTESESTETENGGRDRRKRMRDGKKRTEKDTTSDARKPGAVRSDRATQKTE